ncbi:MAG TPA: zinc-binding alcohol dehydrogenase family protein [Tepidisphaeraceae bacterium]|nr:zinc-binding alcohol dehydrogenase family protein [Tepidisphaeraceae bacterium]
MRALRLKHFGDVSDLRIEELPTPVPAVGEVLVKIAAASVNASDVKNVQGFMHQTRLPRTPGRDFAGVVVASGDGDESGIGRKVFGTGGDLGFTRDGTHATHLLIPKAAAVALPANLSPEVGSALGVIFVTAAYGLREANLASDQSVAIIGVFGGVGRAAAQIAASAGAKVIGIARRFPPSDLAPSLARIVHVNTGAEDPAAAVRRHTDGRGADIIFDTVGGPTVLDALKFLAPRGRLIEISAGSNPNVTLNIRDFYHQQARLIGVDSLSLDAIECASILSGLLKGLASGELSPPPIAATYPLDQAISAYQAVAGSKGEGRYVLIPA